MNIVKTAALHTQDGGATDENHSYALSLTNGRSMENNRIFGIRLFLIVQIFTLASVTYAEESIGPKLSPRLKELIGKEMRQVSTAMGTIWTGIAQGNHGIVAEQGMMIHDSFIMKHALTKADKKALVATLPPAFLKLDNEFHELAKKLSVAATAHDSELELFYFEQMTETCITCHKTYAGNRFPGFGARPLTDHHH